MFKGIKASFLLFTFYAFNMNPRLLFLLFVLGLFYPACAQENIALGRPYTLSPKPNYSLCLDADDSLQLTDGKITSQGRFWTQKTTVGWAHKDTCDVTIDLGSSKRMGGAAIGMGAGNSGVDWPVCIWMFSSEDKNKWTPVADILSLSTSPPKGYARHTFKAKGLSVKGRYVRFIAVTKGCCTFMDEVEVFVGTALPTNDVVLIPDSTIPVFMRSAKVNAMIRSQYHLDLSRVSRSLAKVPDSSSKKELLKKVSSLKSRINITPDVPGETFRAILPYFEIHREIFQVQASVWRLQKKANLRIWRPGLWDSLSPSSEPITPQGPVTCSFDLLNGEERAAAINLTFAGEAPQNLKLSITGLPAGMSATIRQVEHTGLRQGDTVAAALIPIPETKGGVILELIPGMTRQLWINLTANTVPAGMYSGALSVQGAQEARRVPFQIKVHATEMPAQTFRLGGWDYTNVLGQYFTEENLPGYIKTLRNAGVNTPWATSRALPHGKYNAKGEMVEKPNTENFDAWVDAWPDAACYMVFLAIRKENVSSHRFGGSLPGTPLFDVKVGNWATFWAEHLKEKGIPPSRLGLLITDEPHSKEQFQGIEKWAQAIRKAVPEFVLWNDPRPSGYKASLIDEMPTADVLVPNRSEYLSAPKSFHSYFKAKGESGTELGLFACRDPVRKFDPYVYFNLHFWRCFSIGASWGGFWSFGDFSKSGSMNEYLASPRGPYSPLFFDKNQIRDSKYLEAIREGILDYELLRLLDKTLPKNDLEKMVSKKLAADTIKNFRWGPPLPPPSNHDLNLRVTLP